MPRMVRITAANASTFYGETYEYGMLKAIMEILHFFKGAELGYRRGFCSGTTF